MSTTIGHGVIPISLDPSGVGTGLKSVGTLVSSRLGIAGKAGGLALGAGITAAVGAGVGLFKVGQSFNEMTNTIIKGTGASGKALKGLEASALRVGKTTPSNFSDIGIAIADVNTRLGLTGKPLEDVSRKFLNLSRMTGTDLQGNIKNITRLFGDWSVPTEKQSATLDKLFRASQATGIGVDQLSGLMVQFGSPLRNLGLDFDFTAAMFSRFEKEGVNIQTAMPGLRMALKNFASAGKDPAKALKATFEQIRNAGSAAKANTLAFEIFGTRAGPDMAAAIREGRFDLSELIGTIKNSKGALDDADKRTRTFAESWQLVKNRVMVPLRPLAIKVFDAVGKGMLQLADGVGPVVAKLSGLFSGGSGGGVMGAMVEFGKTLLPVFAKLKPAVADLKTQLAPAFAAVADLIPRLAPIAKVLLYVFGTAVIGAIKGAVKVFTGIVQVISGVIQLVSALIRGDWKAAWGALKKIVSGALRAVVGIVQVWWNIGILSVFKKGFVYLTRDIWKKGWATLKSLTSKGLGLIQKAVLGGLRLISKLLLGAVKGYISIWVNLFKVLLKGAVAGWRALRSAFGGAVAAIRTALVTWWNGLKELFRRGWDAVKTISTNLIRVYIKAVKGVWDGVLSFFRGFFTNTLPGVFRKGVEGLGKIWNGLKTLARQPVSFVVNTVYMGGIRPMVNAIPGVGDLPAIKFAAGGPVYGGKRGKDSVPALLMPGEHVLTTDEVKRAGGHRAIEHIRRLLRRGRAHEFDLPRFAQGGGLSELQILRAQNFAKRQAGKPYSWGGAGPSGYDCSGFMSAVTNVIRGDYPYSRLGSTGTFPWAGFRPGLGQFTIGSFRGSPGHMAGTVGGLNVESAGGVGVRVGSSARGATDGMFNTRAHLGAAGAAAAKAGGFWDAIKAVKRFAEKVAGWFSKLAQMGGWGGMMKSMVKAILGGLRDTINDKIPGPGPLPNFDRGGLWRGGAATNLTGKAERVLTPRQTSAFEQLVDLLARGHLVRAPGQSSSMQTFRGVDRDGPLFTVNAPQNTDPWQVADIAAGHLAAVLKGY